MVKRIQYALWMAWQHRKILKKYCQDPLRQSTCVLDIDPRQLQLKGIAVLAIDYDGVLAAYAQVELSTEISKWLNSCVEVFGRKKVFILTNKPTVARLNYFAEHFGEISIVAAKKKKPYPEGILNVLQLTKMESSQVLVIDDRLLTGILAAIIANTPAIYITNPYISLSKRPIQELFFMTLRLLERIGVKLGP